MDPKLFYVLLSLLVPCVWLIAVLLYLVQSSKGRYIAQDKECETLRITLREQDLRIVELMKFPPRKETLELTAADLLHDLTTKGRAVLKVDVIDMANLLLRSPRD